MLQISNMCGIYIHVPPYKKYLWVQWNENREIEQKKEKSFNDEEGLYKSPNQAQAEYFHDLKKIQFL